MTSQPLPRQFKVNIVPMMLGDLELSGLGHHLPKGEIFSWNGSTSIFMVSCTK